MSRQQRYDIDTVGFGSELGNFYDFYITNTFYLLAPDYYYQMYSTYFNRCLSVFDGWLQGWHDRENGLVPQRLLQSIARGLNNTIFAHGIDFSGEGGGILMDKSSAKTVDVARMGFGQAVAVTPLQLITAFSKYLRANINNVSPTETISFAAEMDHIKTYVDIEKERFGSRLTVLYDIKCDNFTMPPLTVEPLVENAVKHGVCKRVKGGVVKISSWEEEDRYVVTVEDNGVGFNVNIMEQDEKSDSVGLKYIKLRLKELYNADFNIESKKGVGTKATVTFFKENVEG